jgi:hypothetical protein
MSDSSTERALLSTVDLLDSLVAFYQHEQMWVYRTSASLQQAFRPPTNEPSNLTQQAYPNELSMSPVDSRKYEDFDDASSSNTQPTPWMRRKQEFNLRLEGIRLKHTVNTQLLTQNLQIEQPREHILGMFEKMMEARMESCQRVRRLVQDASRDHNR